ncbi:MAG: DNA-deoxyinosine glycosylase [Pseudomonadota bacterium]
MPRRSSPARGARLKGFPPVIDARVETLILGSFPSEASLAAGQYYAHPRNQFWTILGRVLGEPLAELPYEARLARVLAHRIGIWDVLGACERAGSLDASIRNHEPNDFALLHRLAPRLKRVIFNGRTAGRYEPLFGRAGFETAVVPSTSPAHAGRTLQQKLALWRRALKAARRR